MKGNVRVLLNFRKAPSLSAKIIGALKAGEAVEVNEDCGEWLKIQHGKKNGYVMSEYVDLEDEPSVEPEDKTESTNEKARSAE